MSKEVVRALKARKAELSAELRRVEGALASFGVSEVKKKKRKYTKRVVTAVKVAAPKPPSPAPAKAPKPAPKPLQAVKGLVRKPVEDDDDDE